MTTFASLSISATRPSSSTTLLSLSSSPSRVRPPRLSPLMFAADVSLGWSRLLLADGPRQTINGLTLYAVWLLRKENEGEWYEITKYFEGNSLSTTGLTLTALFTVLVFLGSLLLLVIAAICYIPLLCHIQGNLKVCLCLRDKEGEFLMHCHVGILLSQSRQG